MLLLACEKLGRRLVATTSVNRQIVEPTHTITGLFHEIRSKHDGPPLGGCDRHLDWPRSGVKLVVGTMGRMKRFGLEVWKRRQSRMEL